MSSVATRNLSAPNVLFESARPQQLAALAKADNAQLEVEVIEFNHFDAQLRQDWQRLRLASPAYRSPFFSLEFMDAAAEARRDARLVVIRKRGQVVGFLPIQLSIEHHALPLGGCSTTCMA